MLYTALLPAVLVTLVSSTLALPTPPPATPACDASYNYSKVNKTLRLATLNEVDTISTQSQMTAASVHIIGYDGFADLIPGIVQPVTDSLNKGWIPALSSALVKCAACKASDGTVEHAHVRKFPVVPYELLYNVFDVTTNMLLALDQKQCDVPGYTPPSSVVAAMTPFLASVKATVAALQPIHDCLATHGSANATAVWTAHSAPLEAILTKLEASPCVAQ